MIPNSNSMLRNSIPHSCNQKDKTLGNHCLHTPASITKLELYSLRKKTLLRLPQDPHLPITRRIRRHIQPPNLIPRQPGRPKATRAIPRPIPLTPLNRGIKKHVLSRRSTSQRLYRRITPISRTLELHSHELESRDGLAVPAAVVGDIHCRTISIELAVDGGGVGLQS